MIDLRDRLIRVSRDLNILAHDAWTRADYNEHARLHAKRAGVELALTYVYEYLNQE